MSQVTRYESPPATPRKQAARRAHRLEALSYDLPSLQTPPNARYVVPGAHGAARPMLRPLRVPIPLTGRTPSPMRAILRTNVRPHPTALTRRSPRPRQPPTRAPRLQPPQRQRNHRQVASANHPEGVAKINQVYCVATPRIHAKAPRRPIERVCPVLNAMRHRIAEKRTVAPPARCGKAHIRAGIRTKDTRTERG
jgi:hypothetical protein